MIKTAQRGKQCEEDEKVQDNDSTDTTTRGQQTSNTRAQNQLSRFTVQKDTFNAISFIFHSFCIF